MRPACAREASSAPGADMRVAARVCTGLMMMKEGFICTRADMLCTDRGGRCGPRVHDDVG